MSRRTWTRYWCERAVGERGIRSTGSGAGSSGRFGGSWAAHITTYEYDAVSLRTGRIDANGQRTISYQGGPTLTFAYDPTGLPTGVTDAAGVTTMTYDGAGRQQTVVHPGGRTVSYAYDSLGRRSTMTEPGGGLFTYSFDAASRLTGVQNPQGGRTTWAYDPLGRVTTLTHANTTTVTYAHDAASRTTAVRNAKSDGTAIAGFVYTVDEVGNPTGMVLANGDRVTWTYDSLYRLTREQRSGANAYDMTYTYDSSGNRLMKVASGAVTTLSYDQADRLLTADDGATVTAYSWDANGNNTLVQAGASVTTYTWDGENRLTKLALARGRRTWPSPCESLGILTLNLALFAAFIFLMYQYIVPPRTHLGWVDGERRKIQPLPPAVVAGAEDLSREISAAFEAFRDPGKLDAQGFLDAVKAKDAAKIEALRDGVAESWRINQDALAVMHEVAQRANACRLTPERIRAD